MRILYEIVSFPQEQAGYSLIAFTEGTLDIIVDSVVFLAARDILLIEFAIVLHKWILAQDHRSESFYYASMDFEEEPILALNLNSDRETPLLESTWARSSPTPVSVEDFKDAASDFLDSLRKELYIRHGVELHEILSSAAKDKLEQ